MKPAAPKAYPLFIDEAELSGFLCDGHPPDMSRLRAILAKSLAKQPLDLAETAALLQSTTPEARAEIFAAARQLKETVYGNRIVLFAPLYIGNLCVNDCLYCGFRTSNTEAVRRTLSPEEIGEQVAALEQAGHKRLILVFGEHARYNADFIAAAVRKVYETRQGCDEIRRVNINAAPLAVDDYRKIKAAGIGTYQIFQETYHPATYRRMHPAGTPKGDFLNRLHGLTRAFEAGIDDVGIGALFGLYDWRYEVLGLVRHALFLQERFGVGPHTISFPRLQPAGGIPHDWPHLVDDESFKLLVAILRLAVPYTGLILTARESAELRRDVLALGVSQIDAGSCIELGGYTRGHAATDRQDLDREQFRLGDLRTLDEVMQQLLRDGYLPSFCTACYRLGRTGEHFMEFDIPGFIKRFCTPNALLTLAEYLTDYAGPATRQAGWELIKRELAALGDNRQTAEIHRRLQAITTDGRRDLYF
ncbi:MAG: [FeFe] hydrogenase H-cluster radical SAM maturase HydG [Acidobacteria bacterium]|nr:[FeFe] hydrogenase H-cluster radical SAM maturase HydG [Acidobacteriota bacterium]